MFDRIALYFIARMEKLETTTIKRPYKHNATACATVDETSY